MKDQTLKYPSFGRDPAFRLCSGDGRFMGLPDGKRVCLQQFDRELRRLGLVGPDNGLVAIDDEGTYFQYVFFEGHFSSFVAKQYRRMVAAKRGSVKGEERSVP